MKITIKNDKVKIKPLFTDYLFHFNSNPFKIKNLPLQINQGEQNPLEYFKFYSQAFPKGIVELEATSWRENIHYLDFKVNYNLIKNPKLYEAAKECFKVAQPTIPSIRLKFLMDNYIQNPHRSNFVFSKGLSEALVKAPHAPNLSVLPFTSNKIDLFLEFPKIKVANIDKLLGAFIKIERNDDLCSLIMAFFYELPNGDVDFKSFQWTIQHSIIEELKKKGKDNLQGWLDSLKLNYAKPTLWDKFFDKEKVKNLETSISRDKAVQYSLADSLLDPMFQYLLNCLLFIYNTDELKFSQNEFKQNSHKKKEEFSLEKVCILGEDFKQIRYSSSTHSRVSSHYRWQPYGSGEKKYKLIKIDEYTKKNIKPLWDEECLEEKGLGVIQWEKNARVEFDKLLYPWAAQHGFSIREEHRVCDNSLHKIDYILVNANYIIGVEFKSDDAKWSEEKIEIQRRFYHKNLKAQFPHQEVHTFLASNKGKYGLTFLELVGELEGFLPEIEIEPHLFN